MEHILVRWWINFVKERWIIFFHPLIIEISVIRTDRSIPPFPPWLIHSIRLAMTRLYFSLVSPWLSYSTCLYAILIYYPCRNTTNSFHLSDHKFLSWHYHYNVYSRYLLFDFNFQYYSHRLAWKRVIVLLPFIAAIYIMFYFLAQLSSDKSGAAIKISNEWIVAAKRF